MIKCSLIQPILFFSRQKSDHGVLHVRKYFFTQQGHDDAWVAHQDDFAAALDQLNQVHAGAEGKDEEDKDDGAEVKAKSLENTSKTLKKRVQ